MIKILPSTNPFDEDNLVEHVVEMQNLGLDFVHCDVMDGIFVKNKCLSIEKLIEIRNNSLLGLDVHIMVYNPLEVIDDYIKIKPNIITFHLEALNNKKDVLKCIDKIHKKGILAGISLKPETSIDSIIPYLPLIDLVLIMSVEPGLSGQEYIKNTELKVTQLSNIIKKNRLFVKIEIDGGIKDYMVHNLAKLGVDYFVIGNAYFIAKDKSEFLKRCNN